MGNIASVHLEKGKIGEFFHNDRSKPTKNSIFKENKVIVNRSAKAALELYQKLLKERTEKYVQRTGRKLQKKTQTLLSLVVNIKEDTTMEELEKLAKKFEDEFGATPLQIAIHRDEGYIDENGNKHINQHAHIMLTGLDENGFSIKRKIKTRHFRAMQDWASEILGMERGRSARETKRKRLDTYEYKEAMKLKNQEVIELKKKLIEKDNQIEGLKISKKELEEQIKLLREEMKNFNEKNGQEGKEKEFSQADYKALSEIKKLLKAKNFKEAVEKLKNFENEIKQRIKKRQKELIEKYAEEKGVFSKEEVIQKDIAIKIVNTVCKTDSDKNVIQIIRENEELKKKNQKLKEENAELKQKLLKAKEKFEELKIKANQILKAKVSYFKELYEKTRAELENFYQKESRPYTKLNEREKEVEKQIERKHKINPNKTYTIDF